MPTLRKHAEAILALGRAAARARAGARRPVRPLRVGPRLRAARPLRQPSCARRSATYLKTVFDGRLSAYYPAFPEGGLARVHFIIGRSGGKTPKVEPGDARGRRSATSCGPGRTRCARPRPSAAPTRALAGDRRALSRRAIAAASRRPRRWPTPAASPGSARQPDRHRLLPPRRPGAGAGGAEDLPFRQRRWRCRGACRCWRTWASASSASAPSRSATTTATTVFIHDMELENAFGKPIDLARRRRAVRGGVPFRLARRQPTMTATTRWPRPPACGRARSASCAPMAAICSRPAFRRARISSPPRSTAIRRSRAALYRAVRRPLRSGGAGRGRGHGQAPQGEDQGCAGRGSQHRRRHHHPPLPQPDRSLAAHQSFRCRNARRGPVAGDQARLARGRRPAGAAAVARDLRLRARGRGRASALRAGGARRPALVGPGPGLPHRSARPGQGAAGQERRHRAGRRQGRLLSRSACRSGGSRDAIFEAGTQAYVNFVSSLLSITDNLDGDEVVPPAERGAPRRRRSLFRRRRRQGHRDLLRHRQRHQRRSMASGSTTPSPPAARPATTTRRWASPPGAPGRRSSGISAR